MSKADLETFETAAELALLTEYREVVGAYRHVVETERRFYLANEVELTVHNAAGSEVYFEVLMRDCWVWDVYRSQRKAEVVHVLSFKDVSVEELPGSAD